MASNEPYNKADGPSAASDKTTAAAPVSLAPLSESQFHQLADQLMQAVEDAVAEQADDCDAELTAGILTLDSERGKIIMSRQSPLREIWLAAKSGGFHFRFDGTQWLDTRDGMRLQARLQLALQELGESEILLKD
jgi:CyaY protein